MRYKIKLNDWEILINKHTINNDIDDTIKLVLFHKFDNIE